MAARMADDTPRNVAQESTCFGRGRDGKGDGVAVRRRKNVVNAINMLMVGISCARVLKNWRNLHVNDDHPRKNN